MRLLLSMLVTLGLSGFVAVAQQISESLDGWLLGPNQPEIEHGYHGNGETGDFIHVPVGTDPFSYDVPQAGNGSVTFWVNDRARCTDPSSPSAYPKFGPRWGLKNGSGEVITVGISRHGYLGGCTGYSAWSSVAPVLPRSFSSMARGAYGASFAPGWYKWTVDGSGTDVTFTVRDLRLKAGDEGDSFWGFQQQTYDASFSGGIWAGVFGNGWQGFCFAGDGAGGIEDVDVQVVGGSGVFSGFGDGGYSGVHTITTGNGGGGSIIPFGTIKAYAGDSYSFAFVPDHGHEVNDIRVDGSSLGVGTQYTFSSVSTNHNIYASFKQKTFELTVGYSYEGSISPSGPTITKQLGSDQMFEIRPGPGKSIFSVLVDGKGVGATPQYYFDDIDASHTISVLYQNAFNPSFITVASGANGSVVPEGAFQVNRDTDVPVRIQPDEGYQIDSVVVNDSLWGSQDRFTFTAVGPAYSVYVTFKPATHMVFVNSEGKGHVEPAGTVHVAHNANLSLSIEPDAGAVLENVIIDGIMFGAIQSVPMGRITSDHTLEAYFFSNTGPAVPEQVNPVDSAVIDSNYVLVWAGAYDPDPADVVTFDLEISRDTGFGSIEYVRSGINSGSAVLRDIGEFEADTEYYWRLRAFDDSGVYSDYSESRMFTVDNTSRVADSHTERSDSRPIVSIRSFTGTLEVGVRSNGSGRVKVNLLDQTGNVIEALYNKRLGAFQEYCVKCPVPTSGIYYIIAKIGTYIETRKVMLIK